MQIDNLPFPSFILCCRWHILWFHAALPCNVRLKQKQCSALLFLHCNKWIWTWTWMLKNKVLFSSENNIPKTLQCLHALTRTIGTLLGTCICFDVLCRNTKSYEEVTVGMSNHTDNACAQPQHPWLMHTAPISARDKHLSMKLRPWGAI